MAYSRKKFSRKTSSKGKKTYKRKSAPRRKSSIKKMIKREISRNVENKTQQAYVFERILRVPGALDFDTQNVIPLGPDPTSLLISQGVGQGQRIGNAIKTKRFMFKGSMNPQPYEASTNPQPVPTQVKMWIFYDKTLPTNVPTPAASGDFFQNGNTTRSFSTDLVDMWSPVNSDRYRILATKTFKLGYEAYTGTGSLPTFGNVSNNDFKLNCNFSFNLTKHYPKIVKFNDGSTQPTTRGLYCMWEFVSATGNPTGAGVRAVNVQYMQDYHYEDA